MKIDTIKSGGQSQGGLDNSGGTLSGPLILSRDPQVPMEAATKRYVDNTLSSLSASNVVTGTLPIARLPAFSGDVTSEAGGNNIVLSNTGVTVGEYGKIVVDAKGRATNGTGLGNSDIPNFDFSKIITDKPTTLAGYGVTDAVSLTGGAMTGALILSGSPSTGDNLVPKQYIDGMVNTLAASKTGDVIRKAYATTPVGFLKCNGGFVSKTTYADLYAIIGESNLSYNFIGSGKPWKNQYEFNKLQSVDIGDWTTGVALPTVLNVTSVIVTKNRVYLLGGYNGSYLASVYTAPINSDGTLGGWTTGTSLPGSLGWSQAIVTKNRVYLLGGHNGISVVSTVYTAPINTDGTLGAWSTDSSLPGILSSSQAIIIKNRVYLLGGYNGTNHVSTVYTAPINSDGTLGGWATGTSLPGALSHSQAVITKNRVYLLGGNDTTGQVSTIYTATIDIDGLLGTWTTSTSLPFSLSLSSSIVTNSRVYLIGGISTGNTYISNIVHAPINTDGSIGNWTAPASLPVAMANLQLIATNGKIYTLGGTNTAGSPVNTVYITSFSGGLNDYSAYYTEDKTNYMMPGSGRPWQQQYEINATQIGDITGWVTTTPLPETLSNSQAVVTKNRVYLLGGRTSTNTWLSTVYTALINADGTLGTWVTTTSLPVAIGSAHSVVAKNRVYLIGGTTDGTNTLNTVYTAPINADGTLGAWTTGVQLPNGIRGGQAIITKNRIYLLVGYNGTIDVSTTFTAAINSDGSLGTWTTGTSLPTVLFAPQIVMTKNRIYLLGGRNSTTWLSSVYSTTINSDGIIGTWSTEASLPAVMNWSQVIVTKNCVYLLGGWNNIANLSTVYIGTINSDGTLGNWVSGTSLPIGLSSSQVIITKNRIHILGGSNGNAVYTASIGEGLNDYSAYYDGSISPLEPVNPSTLFKLPDMSATDVNGIYHYIKF